MIAGKEKNKYYYKQIKNFYRTHIPKNQRVLEIGCGTGDILNCVAPREGVGIDISEKMVCIASKKYPRMEFLARDAKNLEINQKFEYVIMADLINHVDDVWKAFKEAENALEVGGRFVLNTINPLWKMLFYIFEKLKFKIPGNPHHSMNARHICSLLECCSFKLKKQGYFLFMPRRLFGIADILNRYAPSIPLLRRLCRYQYIVAEKIKPNHGFANNFGISVIIPCHNEEMNIAACFSRIPEMAVFQEVVFINDASTDQTEKEIRKLMDKDKRIKLISYPEHKGKSYALKMGFEAADGDVLAILDTDMSVKPEDLPKFFSVINGGKGDFVNGTRMVYPVKQAMNAFYVFGNKIFSLAFTWILGQYITDTLCGTKAFLKKDYEKIKLLPKNDPWGDFDLLLGAAELGLKIVEMPVYYQKRIFGYSKMKPLKHGFILLLRCLWGFKKLKMDRLFKKNRPIYKKNK